MDSLFAVDGEVTQLSEPRFPWIPRDVCSVLSWEEGALLQKGVYLLSLAAMILGTPKAVMSCVIRGVRDTVDQIKQQSIDSRGRRGSL